MLPILLINYQYQWRISTDPCYQVYQSISNVSGISTDPCYPVTDQFMSVEFLHTPFSATQFIDQFLMLVEFLQSHATNFTDQFLMLVEISTGADEHLWNLAGIQQTFGVESWW